MPRDLDKVIKGMNSPKQREIALICISFIELISFFFSLIKSLFYCHSFIAI